MLTKAKAKIIPQDVYYTARKTIFPFSRRLEKMVFPKKLRWNMIFLALLGKMKFLFTENMILYLRRKMTGDLSEKIARKYDIFYKLSENMVFPKGATPAHDFSCIIWKDGIFFPENMIFFPWVESDTGHSQEIHGNMTLSVYTYGCYKRCATPLLQKKSKMVLSRKNTAKGD